MKLLTCMLVGLALILMGHATFAQETALPAADAIMARVATNQDRDEAERKHYIYVQHAHVTSRKGKTIMCEETTDFRVAPSAHGTRSALLKLDGRMLQKHKYVQYTTLLAKKDEPAKEDTNKEADAKGTDTTQASADPDTVNIEVGEGNIDRELVEDMRSGLTNNDSEKSKDGIGSGLFPLTTKSQADYAFHLVGRERMNGRDVFHINFRPKDKSDYGWKGDAYIDAEAYQPVVVSTDMARQIPFAVRTFMGTNLPGLGFTVVYAPQADGTWFPVSFSTEFKLHILFFFSRQIIIDAKNLDFEKTHVNSRIVDAADSVTTQ